MISMLSLTSPHYISIKRTNFSFLCYESSNGLNSQLGFYDVIIATECQKIFTVANTYQILSVATRDFNITRIK